jgi:hypothetical protein
VDRFAPRERGAIERFVDAIVRWIRAGWNLRRQWGGSGDFSR